MNTIIQLLRPVAPTGQWNTSVQAVSVGENMGMRQYQVDNAPETSAYQGHGLSLARAMRLGL